MYSKLSTKSLKFERQNTAIKGFTKQHAINRIGSIDAKSFLDAVRSEVINVLSKTKNLTCSRHLALIFGPSGLSADRRIMQASEKYPYNRHCIEYKRNDVRTSNTEN